MTARSFQDLLGELERLGILLLSDPSFPSVTTFVTGGPIRGSWWAHPQGQDVFHLSEQLADHPDVLVTKLLSGKVTYIHRRLWPCLLAVAMTREAWQVRGLSSVANRILRAVERHGRIRTDELPQGFGTPRDRSEAVRNLERGLLFHSREVHTATGKHAKILVTWSRWAEDAGLGGPAKTPAQAKRTLSDVVGKLNASTKASARLPWDRPRVERVRALPRRMRRSP